MFVAEFFSTPSIFFENLSHSVHVQSSSACLNHFLKIVFFSLNQTIPAAAQRQHLLYLIFRRIRTATAWLFFGFEFLLLL